MPDGYPDLKGYTEVAIDLETKDPNLTTLGSGWARRDGYIIGVAVAVEGGQWYFPSHDHWGIMKHIVTINRYKVSNPFKCKPFI